MRKAWISRIALVGAVCALGAGCASVPESFYMGYAYSDEKDYKGPTLTFGLAPIAIVGRTGLDNKLEVDNPGGFELNYANYLDDFGGNYISFRYIPLLEEVTSREAYVIQFGIGSVFAHPFRDWNVFWRTTIGFRLTYLGLDWDDRDTFGFGMFARGALVVHVWRMWGLELFADIDGWGGCWDDGPQLGGSASLGLNIACSF